MSTPQAYLLPLRGLGRGFYEYDFLIDEAFLSEFPESTIKRAAASIHLTLDRQLRQMTLEFSLKGTVATDCDRCLAPIDLPVVDQRRLVIKLTEEADDNKDEGDVIYLHPETNDFNLAPYLYETVILAVPMIRTYDCREGQPPYPCDEDLLDRIEGSVEAADEAAAPEADTEGKPSPWDILKGLNKKDQS